MLDGLGTRAERALTALVRKLKAEGITDKRGKPIDKFYKLLNNRVYLRVRKGASRQAHGDP